jgi:multiple sugar transport system permease protein
MSFFNWSLVGSGTSEFLGLGNYAEALSDPNFWGSLWNTIVFTVISTPILVVLSLALALMVNGISRRVQWIYRLAFFASYTLSVSVMALIWSWMFEPGFGLLNGVLTSLGLPSVNWLTQPPCRLRGGDLVPLLHLDTAYLGRPVLVSIAPGEE